MQEKSYTENAKKVVEKYLGIPYSVYEQLDVEEQHLLIETKRGEKVTYGRSLDPKPITKEELDKRMKKSLAASKRYFTAKKVNTFLGKVRKKIIGR